MAFVKKLALGSIFISILCIFAMSHNVSAIDLSINLDDYVLSRNLDRTNEILIINQDTTRCNTVSDCTVYNTTDFATIQKFTTSGAYSFKANDIVIWRVFIGSQGSNGTYTNIVPFIQRNFTTNNNNLIYLGYNEHIVNNQNFYSQLGYGPNANEFYTQINGVYNDLRVIEYYFRVLADGNYQIGFESNNYSAYRADIFSLASYSTGSAVYFRSIGLTGYSQTESKENKEVEQKTQEAVDESQAAGSDSSSSASTGGANLLTAITGFFNVITNAQPTNCRFNAPLNTYFGNQRLNIDLCSLDLPSGIGTLTSIIAICIIIPFAIHMFNKFIALFRSFQN